MNWLTDLNAWLDALRTDPEIVRLLVASVLGIAAFAVVLAIYFLVTGLLDPIQKRLHSVKGTEEAQSVKRESGGLITSIGKRLIPKALSKRTQIETLLIHAGFRAAGDLHFFYGIRLVAALVAPLLVIAVMGAIRYASPADALPYALAASALGFLLPEIVLKRLALRRQERLRRGLPDALDLLVVCSEAGLGLNAGIQRVGKEIVITHPDLADELNTVTLQGRAGIDNRAALKGLEERTGLDDIQALVTTLDQSMRFGTSVGDTLRIYSAELRDKRLQRAQEKAAKIAVLMLLPLVSCILPSFLLVVLGPAMIGLMKAFEQIGGGG